MAVLFIVLMFFLVFGIVFMPVWLPEARRVVRQRKEAKALATESTNLLDYYYKGAYDYYGTGKTSKAGYTVAREFRGIPEKYHPFSGNELVRTLQALDLKWGDLKEKHGWMVRYHEEDFNDWFWTCECMSGWKRLDSKKHNCKLFDDYGRLVWEFKMISVRADEQERAFKLDGRVEATPEHLELLLTRAREESTIITQVTNELLGTPVSIDDSAHLTSVADKMRELIKAKL